MATSTIKRVDEALESTTFTGYGFTMTCYKIGHVVNANVYGDAATSAISSGATILTVGDGWRPVNNQTFLAALITSTGTSQTRMTLDSTGELHTVGTAISQGSFFRFSITYLTA